MASRASIELDLSEHPLPGLLGVSLRDTYCSNPDCDCGGVVLSPESLSCRSDSERWSELAWQLSFVVDVETGQIEARGPESTLRQVLSDELRRYLTKRRLTMLKKRRLGVLRQHAEDGWRFRDWSDFEPGWMLAWADLFPTSPAQSIRTPEGIFFFDDYYCCTFGCECSQVRLVILSQSQPHLACGSVNYDYRTGQKTLDPEPGFPPQVLRDVFEGFFRFHPGLRAELRRRGEFMAGPVATYIHQSVTPSRRPKRGSKERHRPIEPPPEVAPTPPLKVGRNDLCPCGSGRKFKKCCLGKT